VGGGRTMNTYPRESVEFQPVPVYQDGAIITTAIAYSVVATGLRPGAFTAATILAGATGLLVGTYATGTYDVWVQITANPEIPVLLAGSFQIT